MTLAKIAEQVCLTVRKTDADSIAACKLYLGRRLGTIWQKGLWKDSLIAVPATCDPANSTNATGMVWMPPVVGNVLAVRSSETPLDPTGYAEFWRTTLDEFAETGTPMKFLRLPPAVDYIPAGARLVAHYNNTVDSPPTTVLTYINADSESYVEELAYVASASAPVVGAIVVGSAGDGAADVVTIEAWTKNATTGTISLVSLTPADRVEAIYASLGAAAVAATQRQRIRLVRIPTVTTALKVLTKRVQPDWSRDGETCPLPVAEQSLIAFAEGDMLKRGRQMGQAQACYQEALALLVQAMEVETVQENNRPRIIPTGDGFWTDPTGPPGKGDW
jgi:hypothetical protein